MFTPARLRTVLIVLIVLIMISCTTSAFLSLRGGHATRAASIFFAGLAFSTLFMNRLPKKTDGPDR
jgi:hypothetical protein